MTALGFHSMFLEASDRNGIEQSVSETAWGSMPRGCKRDSTVHEPVTSALHCKKPEDYQSIDPSPCENE